MKESLNPFLRQGDWLVTILDCGVEVTLSLGAENREEAIAEALEWHPLGRVVSVEGGS